jgi:hypothetical protein
MADADNDDGWPIPDSELRPAAASTYHVPMPLLHHAGALGDFLLSLPLLRALRSAWSAGRWTLSCDAAHAALVATILPHGRRLAPGSLELAPLTARELDPEQLGAIARRHGGLLGFLPRALEVEAAVRAAAPELPVLLAEPLGRALAGGARIDAVLEEAIARCEEAARRVTPADFAIAVSELPPLAPGAEPLAFLGPGRADRAALIHIGASDRARRPPLAALMELASQLSGLGFAVGWVRGSVEVERGDEPPPGPCLDAPGLLELAHAIVAAQIYIGGDTGPTHLAAALGTPTLAFVAPPNPQWRPRGERARVAASLEEALKALPALLASRPCPSSATTRPMPPDRCRCTGP